jgi:hypothetical protein
MTAAIDLGQDPSFAIITDTLAVVRAVMRPDSDYPPVGGGTTQVQLVTGEGPAWDPLAGRYGEEGDDAQCPNPFVWVRLVSRYRSTNFPEATVIAGCGGVAVLALEIGIGRCVSIEADVDWTVIANEAEWGLDDAFRLDKIACVLVGYLKDRAMVAYEPAVPEGPEGGGIVWSITVYVGIVA